MAAIHFLNPAPLMWDFEHEPERSERRLRYQIGDTTPSGWAEELAAGERAINSSILIWPTSGTSSRACLGFPRSGPCAPAPLKRQAPVPRGWSGIYRPRGTTGSIIW